MRRRFIGMLLIVGAFVGFGSGFAHLKHTHQDAPCQRRASDGPQVERDAPQVQEHIHDAEGRVYVRPARRSSDPQR